MTREQITQKIFEIFQREFEIVNPGLDDDLRETYGFDSVDAIELLLGIEQFLHLELTHEEKKMAMEIRTIKQIIDYVEIMAKKRDTLMKTDRMCSEADLMRKEAAIRL